MINIKLPIDVELFVYTTNTNVGYRLFTRLLLDYLGTIIYFRLGTYFKLII